MGRASDPESMGGASAPFDPVTNLHRVREAFGDLLRMRPDLRETVRQSHARYLEMVSEQRQLERVKQQHRRAKVRAILGSGRLSENIKGKVNDNRPGWHTATIRGLFPARLVKSTGRKTRRGDPKRLEARLAKSALVAMDWEDRLASAGSEKKRVRRWKQWTAGYRAGREVEHTIHIGYFAPEGSDPPPDPASFNWDDMRKAPLADRLTLACVRLGGLWDTLSLDPIVAPLSDPALDDAARVLRWVDDDAVRPRGKPAGPDRVPTLDPGKLSPELAWRLLELLEHAQAGPAPKDDQKRAKASRERNNHRPLSPVASAVYRILLGIEPHEARPGPALLKALGELKPPVYSSQNELTSRIIPELRRYGVMNARRLGYYIDPPSRTPADARHMRG